MPTQGPFGSGQSPGCLGGISREAKLRGGGGKASLSFLPLNTLAKPAGGGGEAKLPFPLTPWANQQPNPPLPPTFGGGWALPRGLGSEAPHRLRGGPTKQVSCCLGLWELCSLKAKPGGLRERSSLKEVQIQVWLSLLLGN